MGIKPERRAEFLGVIANNQRGTLGTEPLVRPAASRTAEPLPVPTPTPPTLVRVRPPTRRAGFPPSWLQARAYAWGEDEETPNLFHFHEEYAEIAVCIVSRRGSTDDGGHFSPQVCRRR